MRIETVKRLLFERETERASDLNNSFKSLKNNPKLLPIITERAYFDVANYHLNLYPEDTVTAKKLLFKAARGIEFNFWYAADKYPQYKFDTNSNSRNIIGKTNQGFVSLILCDHEDIFVSSFKQMQEYIDKDDKINKNPWVAVAFAFRNLILGEFDEAKYKMDNYYKINRNEWGLGLANVLLGILNNDIKLINKGIKHEIQLLIKYQKNNFDFSPKATALAKLAMRFGFEPDISSSFINKKMLIHEDVDYEDIDDLFKALGVEPLTRYKLKNY
jgi:hypothetical protein